MLPEDLKNIAIRATLARVQTLRHRGFVGQTVFASLAHQGAQLLDIGAWVGAKPLFHGRVLFQQTLAPSFGQMQDLGFFGAAAVLGAQGVAQGLNLGFVELAHEFAHILHLSAFAFEIGDFFGVCHRFMQ